VDQQLPVQMLQAVPHVTFSIFNFAIPTIIAFAVLIFLFLAGAWARIPRFIAGPHEVQEGREDTPEGGDDRP
jgi:hypothetical protein